MATNDQDKSLWPTDIRRISYAGDLEEGARNAMEVCLRVRSGERITLITDRETAEIAASLTAQADRLGAECRIFVLEDYTERPMSVLPLEILFELDGSAVGIYCASVQPGEVFARGQAIRLASQRKIRFAHMVGITRQVMVEAMRADFHTINRLSLRLLRMLRDTRCIRVTTTAGTDLEATFYPHYRWIKTSGLISRDIWGNLPGGEIFTAPASVDGVFVANATIGDHFCQKYGDLEPNPLILEIREGRLQRVTCTRPDLKQEFYEYCHAVENSDRVGEFAIGTNLNVKHFIGNMLQDEKHPGIHIAFGEPCGNLTGADWRCKLHVDLLTRGSNIWLDGVPIMENDRFLLNGFANGAAG